MYKTVVYSNREALDTISGLYLQRDLHLDVCFKTGSFYRGSVLWPEIKQDIKPCTSDVLKIDCTDMGHPRNSIRSVMFDPPWLISAAPVKKLQDPANKRRTREKANDIENIMHSRYGSFPSAQAMFDFQAKSLREISRVLIPGGFLVTKLQDCTYGRQKYFLSVYQVNKAREFSLDFIDSLVLVSRASYRSPAAGRLTAISSHCFFHVYRKAARAKRIIRY